MAKQATLPPRQPLNLKLVLTVGLAVAFVGAVIVVARPGATDGRAPQLTETQAGSVRPDPAQNNRMLLARESTFDFGTISMAAGKVTHKYWIRNTGDAPVVIRKMYTSCMCTTAALVKFSKRFPPAGMPGHGFIPAVDEPISPNEAATIEVVFDPAAHGPAGIGRIERVVTIETDRERPLELAFVANVTP